MLKTIGSGEEGLHSGSNPLVKVFMEPPRARSEKKLNQILVDKVKLTKKALDITLYSVTHLEIFTEKLLCTWYHTR
jgi:hypothetical protein